CVAPRGVVDCWWNIRVHSTLLRSRQSDMRIRAFALSLAFASLAAAGPAPSNAIDFSAPGGGSIDLQTDPGNRAVVRSQYWRLEFDLRNGGVLDTIVFLHGSGKNLLLQPLVTSVGPWSDRNAPAVTLNSSR